MHVRSSSQPGVSELCVGVLTVKHLPCFHGRKDVLLFSTYCFCIFPLERESWELKSRGGKQVWI